MLHGPCAPFVDMPCRYVQFDSHHPSSVKYGVVRCIAERAIRVSSSEEARDEEFRRISQVMVCNGYPRKFVQKAISRQVKSRAARRVQPQQDQSKAVTVRIPFIDGLSQEVRRVARAAGVRWVCGVHFIHQTLGVRCITPKTHCLEVR